MGSTPQQIFQLHVPRYVGSLSIECICHDEHDKLDSMVSAGLCASLQGRGGARVACARCACAISIMAASPYFVYKFRRLQPAARFFDVIRRLRLLLCRLLCQEGGSDHLALLYKPSIFAPQARVRLCFSGRRFCCVAFFFSCTV